MKSAGACAIICDRKTAILFASAFPAIRPEQKHERAAQPAGVVISQDRARPARPYTPAGTFGYAIGTRPGIPVGSLLGA